MSVSFPMPNRVAVQQPECTPQYDNEARANARLSSGMIQQFLVGFSVKTMNMLAKSAARIGTEWLLRYSGRVRRFAGVSSLRPMTS